MNDVSPENLLKQIEIYLNKQNYREAYSVWERLKQLQDDGTLVSADLTDLFRKLNRGAQSQRQALVARLEATFAPGIDILQRDLGLETQNTLDALYDASLPDDEYDYQRLKVRFETLKTEQQHRREYENTRKIVEDYWLQAEKAMSEDRSIVGRTLLERYYEPALSVAREASENSPHNKLLEQLALQAQERRERFNTEEEIMTSGGQIGDFVKVLKRVNSLKDDELVMVYDNTGSLIARMSKQDARAEVIKNAKAYVASKVTVYTQETVDALKADNPREAQSRLERYQKFIDLDQYAAGENILNGGQKDTYSQLQQQVNEALAKLEGAEQTAERAIAELEQDPFGAWNIYIGALRQYNGAARSSVVKQAAERITTATRSHIKQQLAVINTQLETFDYQDALKAVDALNAVFVPIWGALNNTDGLVEGAQTILATVTSELNTERTAIETARKAAQEGINKKAAINKALVSIRDLSAREPQNAKRDLDAILSDPQYGAALVQADPLYGEVNSRVSAVVDAAGLLEDFKKSLALNSLHDVRKKQEEAQKASERVNDADYKRYFSDVAVQLGFKARLLEAEARRYQDGDAATIDVYEAVKREPALDSALRQEIEKRLIQLGEERSRTQNNNKNLDEASDALTQGQVAKVWKSLSKVQRFSDDSQTQRWLDLLNRSAESASVEMPFDLNDYNAVLGLARAYSTQTADSFTNQTRKYAAAQKARDAEEKGELSEALRLWNEAKTLVSGIESQYFTTEANRLQRRVIDAEFAELKRKLRQIDGETQSDVLADIKEFLEELRGRAVIATDPTDKLAYWMLTAEAELDYALNHPNPDERHKTLKTIGENAVPLQNALDAYNASFSQERRWGEPRGDKPKPDEAIKKKAAKVLAWVDAASSVSDVLRDVELYVIKPKEKDDVSLFGEAVNKWNDRFSDAKIEEGYRTLLGWYARETGALRGALVSTLNSSEKTEKAYLLSGTRLLMLNPQDADGQKMLVTLESIDTTLGRSLIALFNQLAQGENESLQSQLQQLNMRMDYLRLLEQVLALSFVNNETSQRQEPHVTRWTGLLEKVTQQYQAFKLALDQFNNGIRDDVDYDNWQAAPQVLDGLYTTLETKVQGVGDVLEKILRDVKGVQAQSFKTLHEYHDDMLKARDELKKQKMSLTKVSDICNTVKKLAESDEFSQALDAIRMANDRIKKDANFKALWDTSLIPSALNVHFTDGKTAAGWEDVEVGILSREARLRRVRDWEKQQGKAVGWDNLSEDIDKEEEHAALMQLYQNRDYSQAVKFQILALADEGRFGDARRLLKTVREGDSNALRGYVSLKEAQNYFTQYPLADRDNAHTPDIQKALDVAGSKTARVILEETYRAAQNAQSAFDDAETLENTLRQREKRWGDLTGIAEGKLKSIADFRKRHRRLRRGDVNALNQLVTDYQSHTNKMRSEYPYHLELDAYENHPILDDARGLLRQHQHS